MEIKEFIKKFAEIFDEIDVVALTPETPFHELEEWSSLESLCLISMADEEFGKKIKYSDIRGCTTIEDLYNLILK